jgi:hypothetical protein
VDIQKMSRPAKIGLDYFSLDCSFDSDTAIRRLVARNGAISKLAYIELCIHAYRDYGYYLPEDDAEFEIIAFDCGIDFEDFKNMIKNMVEVGLFIEKQYGNCTVITSRRMQEHYRKVKNYKAEIAPELDASAPEMRQSAPVAPAVAPDAAEKSCASFCIENVDKDVESAESTALTTVAEVVNAGKSTQRKEKESKVKKSTLKTYAQPAFAQFWDLFPRHLDKAKAAKAWEELDPNPELCKKIIDSIKLQRENPLFTEKQFANFPYAQGWLNNRRWEDEVEIDGEVPEAWVEAIANPDDVDITVKAKNIGSDLQLVLWPDGTKTKVATMYVRDTSTPTPTPIATDFFNATAQCSIACYSRPTQASELLGSIDAGECVEVTQVSDHSNQWLKIKRHGWVQRGYIEFVEERYEKQFK